MKNQRLKIILLAIPVLLLIPLIVMQFTDEVSWNVLDFVVMGILLLVTGLLVEFVLRKVRKPNQRIALVVATVIVFLLIWAELAVGIFGTMFAGT